MGRLVDADALSELVKEPIDVFLSRLDLKCPPIIDLEPHWVPVTERLPKKNGRYWVWADKEYTPDHVDEPCSYKGSTEASFINGRWFGSHIGKNVYAWMPLPAPYKEDEK